MSSNSDFTLKQLSYFLAVARYGSVTAAANAVELSQSAMSNAIAELEKSLGVQLLVRQPARGMFLTTAGEILVSRAGRLLEDAEEIAAQVRASNMLLRGPLNIGCYASFVPTVMPAVLAEYMGSYPDVDVRLREGSENQLIDWLRAGECDLAVTYGVELPPDVSFDPLVTLTSYVLVSTSHPLAEAKNLDLEALRDTPFIMLDLPPSGDYFRSILNLHGIRGAPRFRTSSVDVVRSLVANNMGFTILTQPRLGIGEGEQARRLRAFQIDSATPKVEVGVARLATTTMTRRASVFRDILERLLPQEVLGRQGEGREAEE